MAAEIQVGSEVTLRQAPGYLQRWADKQGTVENITCDRGGDFADVYFVHEGTEHVIVIPVNYLQKVRSGKAPRRGVLNLHLVEDDRTEEQKQADAQRWLESMGYGVLGVGQHRSGAVCWACTREQSESAGQQVKPVKVFCPVHKRPVYSPDTGNDEGVTDWQVRHSYLWPPQAVLLVEWKRDARAKRRQKQVEIAVAGWSVIVDSIAALALAIYRFESDDPRIAPHGTIVEWLRMRGLIGGQEAETEEAS